MSPATNMPPHRSYLEQALAEQRGVRTTIQFGTHKTVPDLALNTLLILPKEYWCQLWAATIGVW